MEESMSQQKFCQLCRAPLDEQGNHPLSGCPVYTGAAVVGAGICPICGGTGGNHIWAGSGGCPAVRERWARQPMEGNSCQVQRHLEIMGALRELIYEVQELRRALK